MTYILEIAELALTGGVVVSQIRLVRCLKRKEPPAVNENQLNRALSTLSDEEWTQVLAGNYELLRKKFTAKSKPPVPTELERIDESIKYLIREHQDQVEANRHKHAKKTWSAIARLDERKALLNNQQQVALPLVKAPAPTDAPAIDMA